MSKHTPGPWYWSDDEGDLYDGWEVDVPDEPASGIPTTLRGAMGKDILSYQEWTDEGSDVLNRIIGVSQPDARLIAAAPDLLEACLRMLRAHDENWNVSKMDHKPIDDIRAAIAKAEGGAS